MTFFLSMVYPPFSTTSLVRHYANSNGCLSTFVISSKSTMILLQQCCRSFWHVNQALKRRLLFIVYHEMTKNDSAFFALPLQIKILLFDIDIYASASPVKRILARLKCEINAVSYNSAACVSSNCVTVTFNEHACSK